MKPDGKLEFSTTDPTELHSELQGSRRRLVELVVVALAAGLGINLLSTVIAECLRGVCKWLAPLAIIGGAAVGFICFYLRTPSVRYGRNLRIPTVGFAGPKAVPASASRFSQTWLSSFLRRGRLAESILQAFDQKLDIQAEAIRWDETLADALEATIMICLSGYYENGWYQANRVDPFGPPVLDMNEGANDPPASKRLAFSDVDLKLMDNRLLTLVDNHLGFEARNLAGRTFLVPERVVPCLISPKTKEFTHSMAPKPAFRGIMLRSKFVELGIAVAGEFEIVTTSNMLGFQDQPPRLVDLRVRLYARASVRVRGRVQWLFSRAAAHELRWAELVAKQVFDDLVAVTHVDPGFPFLYSMRSTMRPAPASTLGAE